MIMKMQHQKLSKIKHRDKKKSCETTSKNLKQIDVNNNSLRIGKAKGPGKIIAKDNEVYFITVKESIQQDITI